MKIKMRSHKNYAVCAKVCAVAPMFYQNQFGDFCLLSYPNQVMSKERIFAEISFWELIKYKLSKIAVSAGGKK